MQHLKDLVRESADREELNRTKLAHFLIDGGVALLRDSSTGNTDIYGTNSDRTGTSQTYTVTRNPEPHPERSGERAIGVSATSLQSPGRHQQPLSRNDVFSMTKHKDLSSMYHEWFGLGEFDDGKGGIHGRNQTDGAKWRSHINGSHYSRTKRVIQAIQKLATDGGITDQEAIRQLQPLFEESKACLSTMTKNLAKYGHLKLGKPRKRKASELLV
jgi:hypothetical protein